MNLKNNSIITQTELNLVVRSVIDAAQDGDMKAAALIFNHFIPKPKPRAMATPYHSLQDVKDAYILGILTSEEVITTLQAMDLLTKTDTVNDDILWDDNMRDYVAKIAKKD